MVSAAPRELTLTGATNLRFNQNQVLEVASPVPIGAVVTLAEGSAPAFVPYRDSSGAVKSSTNGFYPGVRLISVPASEQPGFPPEKINKLNATPGGLYLSSLDISSASPGGAYIQPLPKHGEPDEVYLKHFRYDGKRRNNKFSARLKQRFGAQFNLAIPFSTMTPQERGKWASIYAELAAAADRTQATERRYWFIDSGSASRDKQLADQYSTLFENSGTVQEFGAWNIAVTGTAPRHGFPNAPCAEYMSEVVRQAYARAGYKFSDDFKGRNYLLWSNTAAVVNLARALHESGWIPWDASEYAPKTGAIAMHAFATTPGHTYLIASEGGRYLVDNGSPYGRDLYRNIGSKDYIEFMYDIGVFFLPPGIIPERWN
jgi:hypothetical protein